MLILIQILTGIEGLLIFYLSLLPLIMIHELGHLAAGNASGLALVRFRVGPIELSRPSVLRLQEPFQLHWRWKWRYLGSGYISMCAGQSALVWPRRRYVIYLLGGPLGNLGSALLALPIALQDTMAGAIAKYFVILSVLLGAGNLIPFARYGLESDGSQLWALLFDKNKRDVQLYWFAFAARLEEIVALSKDNNVEEALDRADILIRLGEQLPKGSLNADQQRSFLAMKEKFADAHSTLVATQRKVAEPVSHSIPGRSQEV